ncbi:hypothetical protein D3C79_510520 [compost metagenome]
MQPAAVAAREEHEGLIGQVSHVHTRFAALCQWVRGIDHRHQRLTEQLGRLQPLGQWHGPHQPDFDGLIENPLSDIAAAHFLEVQMHRREALAEGVDGLGDLRGERRRRGKADLHLAQFTQLGTTGHIRGFLHLR